MQNFNIVSTEDFATIKKLAYLIWPETYGKILSDQQISFMLDSFYNIEALTNNIKSGHLFMLAKNEDEAIGFLSIQHHYQGNPTTRIHKIYLLPKTQGKGLGKRMIDKVVELAKLAGDHEISLNVNRYNSAQNFYKNIGYEIVAEENIDIGNGYFMEDFVMVKKCSM